MKKYERIVDFVAEQNRIHRTGGLPADHPNGKIEPGDYPLSSREKKYFEREEHLYQEILRKLHGGDKD